MRTCILLLSFLCIVVSGFFCTRLLSDLNSTGQWLIFFMLLIILVICLVCFIFNLFLLGIFTKKKERRK